MFLPSLFLIFLAHNLRADAGLRFVFIADDGTKILLVINFRRLFVFTLSRVLQRNLNWACRSFLLNSNLSYLQLWSLSAHRSFSSHINSMLSPFLPHTACEALMYEQ